MAVLWVLQHIAIGYVVPSILMLSGGYRDWLAAIAPCLARYWFLMRFIPVPGFGVPANDIPVLS